MENKYVKVIYTSEPIGKEKIILELTTFDYEAFERDEKLKAMPLKTVSYVFNADKGIFDTQSYMQYVEKQLNIKIDEFYKNEIVKMKALLETKRAILEAKWIEPQPKKIIKGNVINSDNITCDVIEGNVINCDNVQCKEIKGKMINCN